MQGCSPKGAAWGPGISLCCGRGSFLLTREGASQGKRCRWGEETQESGQGEKNGPVSSLWKITANSCSKWDDSDFPRFTFFLTSLCLRGPPAPSSGTTKGVKPGVQESFGTWSVAASGGQKLPQMEPATPHSSSLPKLLAWRQPPPLLSIRL